MGFLADVNLLFALLYAGHSHAAPAVSWLQREGDEGRVLLCRVVQMGVLRLLTNRQVMQDDILGPREAWDHWETLRTDPRFAPVNEPPRLESVWRGLADNLPRGGRLETDSYLAAFALAGGHRLVTFDRGFRRFAGLECVVL